MTTTKLITVDNTLFYQWTAQNDGGDHISKEFYRGDIIVNYAQKFFRYEYATRPTTPFKTGKIVVSDLEHPEQMVEMYAENFAVKVYEKDK